MPDLNTPGLPEHRLCTLVRALLQVDAPPLLPDDPPPPADDHPFGSLTFRPPRYRRDGTRIPTHPADAYLAEVAATRPGSRITSTAYRHHTHLRLSTVFLGWDAEPGRHQPPMLWETTLHLDGTPAGTLRRYTTETAARHGHARLLTAIRARPPRHHRTPPTAGPWRARYPTRWR